MAWFEDRVVANHGYTVVNKFQGALFTAKQVCTSTFYLALVNRV